MIDLSTKLALRISRAAVLSLVCLALATTTALAQQTDPATGLPVAPPAAQPAQVVPAPIAPAQPVAPAPPVQAPAPTTTTTTTTTAPAATTPAPAVAPAPAAPAAVPVPTPSAPVAPAATTTTTTVAPTAPLVPLAPAVVPTRRASGASPATWQTVRLGIRFAPTIALSRVQDKTRDDGNGQDRIYNPGTAMVGFSAGVTVDYFFRPNYALSTGLYFTSKRAAVKEDIGGAVSLAYWNLQMLQIPVQLKLHTSPITDGLRAYFLFGPSLDFVVGQKIKNYKVTSASGYNPKDPEGAPFFPVDLSLWFGAGLEYNVSESTTLTGGISYNRGLVNLNGSEGAFGNLNLIANSKEPNKRYGLRADVIALDLGVKF